MTATDGSLAAYFLSAVATMVVVFGPPFLWVWWVESGRHDRGLANVARLRNTQPRRRPAAGTTRTEEPTS